MSFIHYSHFVLQTNEKIGQHSPVMVMCILLPWHGDVWSPAPSW